MLTNGAKMITGTIFLQPLAIELRKVIIQWMDFRTMDFRDFYFILSLLNRYP